MVDAMAANSGGVEWAAIIKPILSASYGSINKHDMLELCSAINKSESEILHHKDNFKVFYNSFAILAADYISTNVNSLSVNHMDVVCNACRVLLRYLINALQSLTAEPVPNTAQANRLLNAIKSLCLGTGLLSKTDQASLTSTMKSENLPPHIKTNLAGNEKETSKTETVKPRSDLSTSIFEKLTLPLREGQTPIHQIQDSEIIKLISPEQSASTSDAGSEIKRLCFATNIENLQGLRASDILLDLCLNLTSIKRSKIKCDEALAGKPFSLPTTYSEATAIRNSLPSMVVDISVAFSAVSLPILEPLNSTKLEKLNALCMASIHCAVLQASACSILGMGCAVSPKCSSGQATVTSTSSKEDDYDTLAVMLVEKALHMFTYVGDTIKNSTRAGGHVYQNLVLAGAWVLLSGLQTQLSISTTPPLDKEKVTHLKERDDKGRSPSKSRETNAARVSLMKVQQGFGVLLVALSTRTLQLMGELLDDLHLEICGGTVAPTQIEPAPLTIMGQFTALQRAVRLLGTVPLNQLLFYLATITYRKACTLKRIQKHPPEGDTFSQSDSTTYYEDMIMCSDESSTDDDDDSEPILGQWFEETLAPPETTDQNSEVTNNENQENKPAVTERGQSLVPEKGEPHGYIALATQIFTFMNKHLLTTKCGFVMRYVKAGLSEQQMIILAAIIRDLDRETARTETGTISVYFGSILGQLYSDFSGALTRYTHNLVTHSALGSLHASLLNHLGISPWNVDIPHAWPLQVYPRTLAVLAQVLLLRPQQEKEASIISIWRRLVNTLVENVINPTTAKDSDVESDDLNVEHAQVLLYLFHSLNLMQKKSVLLLTAGGVVRGSEVARGPLKDSQLLHLSRLLLLLDYIMKHLYDAPATLLEQIHWNLFSSTNLTSDKDNKENNVSRLYTPWLDIEDNYRKHSGGDEFLMKPRFYAITNMETNNQDVPKLDGLACNFILGTPDKLRYPLLLDALIEILNVTHVTSGPNSSKLTFLGLCATQYCFTICWRLLLMLPPSTPYMDRLSSGENIPAGLLLLHSLVWGPRATHKTFSRWLKDCLVKQGMYTQYTEKLLKSVADSVDTLKYDISVAKNCVIALTPDVKVGSAVRREDLPPLWHLFLLNSVMAKVQVSLLDETEPNSVDSNGSSVPTSSLIHEFLPHVLRLAQAVLHCSCWSLMYSITEQNDSSVKTNQDCELLLLQNLLAVCSNYNSMTTSFAPDLIRLLPSNVSTVLVNWNTMSLEDCSLTPFLNDIITAESYILSIVNAHVSTLSMNPTFKVNLSLKQLLLDLVKFICQHAPKTENTDVKNKALQLLVVLTLDARTEYLHETVQKCLDKMITGSDTDDHQKRVDSIILEHTYKLIVQYTCVSTTNYSIDEKILHCCLKYWEKILERPAGRQALETFFKNEGDLIKVLMSVSGQQMSQQYSTRVLHFFNKLFQAIDKNPTDSSLNYLCSSISRLADVDDEKLQVWLRHVILGTSNMITSSASSNIQTTVITNTKLPTVEETVKAEVDISGTNNPWTVSQTVSSDSNVSPSPSEEQKTLLQENSQLLQALTVYIVKQNSNICEEVAITILKALIPMGATILSPPIEGIGFSDLMVVMSMLADAGSGKGHSFLLAAVTEWLETCKQYLVQKEILDKMKEGVFSGKHSAMLDAACHMLNYVGDIADALVPQGTCSVGSSGSLIRALSPPWEGEAPPELDSEWTDDVNDEEDSAAEDSDEDSLCNKLCTFTVTQKEFMNQHWYHCHTCRMLDGVGVCSVCARVCHRGHDLSYAKYGNFFCDCGAKEDGSCQALVKRSPQTSSEPQPSTSAGTNANTAYGIEPMLTSSLRRRPSSPIIDKVNLSRDKKKNTSLVKHVDATKEWLTSHIAGSPMVVNLLELLNSVVPIVEISCQRNSPVGCQARAQDALQLLHTLEKKCVHTDQLMVPTLGSQEGAFENVRMSYAGEQGQTIRQLLSAHIVRRVAMCCMSSTHGKRQHLAVSHEKGKITVLQLSALLKQADSAKRKLTLTRLASAPIPFTVLTLSGNPCNEDFLAVCGLRDCHVLTFSSTGSVVDHLVLHPQLETGNFIIRAIWLPGSQTDLALITADFVKIYNLAKDALSPQYFFLVPSGKIRDCTFMYEDGVYHILLMSSPGHIYTETLNEESSAKHGTFYVTNTLEVFHMDVTDVNGQVAGGGVSIYYSHTLGLLFFSYAQGKSFIAPLSSKSNCLTTVYQIQLTSGQPSNSSSSKSNGSKTLAPQPLCQWTEIANHPGLICSVMQTSNNPVIIMLKPDAILVQEIKVMPAKAKIMDMVAIRHTSGSELRTTLILLCEDGSLRIYMANMEQTGTWMSLSMQPVSPVPLKTVRKRKAVKQSKTSNSVSFPVDFFEHCQPMNDVEIGGNDLLQVYNMAQLKHRLNTTGMYVVCTKPLGFNVEITNPDNNMVMTGIRVLLGSQDAQRAPSYIEVFGRAIATAVTRNRWYDIPFTREESLQSDKKLTITFGPSQDPLIITMVDSIKVYGKTKDVFGWPEEPEETVNTNTVSVPNTNTNTTEQDPINNSPVILTSFDVLVSSLLEVLESSFSLFPSCDDKLATHKSLAMEVTSKLLCLPTPASIQMHTKALLCALHSARIHYHNYKDNALLAHVLESLTQMRNPEKLKEIDAENFFRLILIVRGIAVARPQNLVKFAEVNCSEQDVSLDDPLNNLKPVSTENYTAKRHLLYQLVEVLWILDSLNPDKPALAPVVVPGLKHTEQITHALCEIIHAFNICETTNPILGLYMEFLLSENHGIAFSARQAICRVLKPRGKRRRVYIPSPPHCITPPERTNGESEEEKQPSTRSSQEEDETRRRDPEARYDVDSVETIGFLQPEAHAGGGQPLNLNPLEALLGGGAGFPQLLDIPPDADDETMVELAIALSLQDHELTGELRDLHQQGAVIAGQALHSLQQVLANQGLVQPVGVAQGQEIGAGHYSDTTASATGSDDEGSTAATDGSTLRTSPAEQGGSAGSESGGSGADSITGEQNASGRSSSYGDNIQEAISLVGRTDNATATTNTYQATEKEIVVVPESETEIESEVENANKLHTLRILMLEKLIAYIPKLKVCSGARVIPFMQVILVLSNELDGSVEKDRQTLDLLLKTIINELKMGNPDTNHVCQRTKEREVHFICMRLLSVILSRWRPTSASKSSMDNTVFLAQQTAAVLIQSNIIDFCLKYLQSLLTYWKAVSTDDNSPPIGGVLLKEHLTAPPPDMNPFFLKQYVKGHAADIFELYPQLLTEIVLRLPYQIHKNLEVPQNVTQVFDQAWYKLLCEYMMTSQTPFVRRQVRKLLLFICGNKEKYRQLRDLHSLETHVQAVEKACKKGGYDETCNTQYGISLPYDSLVELMEHLKACQEVAQGRTGNWQRFCLQYPNTLSFLMQVSYLLDDGVSSTVLQLLQNAICNEPNLPGNAKKSDTKPTSVTVARKDREKSEESEESKFEEANCVALVDQLSKQIPQDVLKSFIRTFLLETNSTNVRWQAHALLFAIYKHSKLPEQESLVKLLWNLWPCIPAYGRKATQFVDLLGYCSLRCSENTESEIKINEYVEQAVSVLKTQNEMLAHHPNANLYANIAQFVELEGYYLESEPCLVCNNPEVPLATIKLSAIKVDSKFTTTTQIVKLVGSHTISKITLRIGDLKRTKMVRTINFYYNNRSVQAVVELKNKPALWHKAKKVTLQSGQTEVKIDFPLAIVACNLMIEYADFYENIQASSETLQCPRCSAAVPANPGVCANCGENVFQCHKCRAINYDEKDPFLCHACGFCKYAKFDYTLLARPCCAVETIETDDDRKKMVGNINSLLEKADRVYKQLMGNKPSLEASLLKISEHRMERRSDDMSTNVTTGIQVNKTIQMLAQQYCSECKTSFEELSKIIQKVLVSRKELVTYDRKQTDSGPMKTSYLESQLMLSDNPEQISFPFSGRCFGCASAATEHCLTLLKALATVPSTRVLLYEQGLIQELVWNNLRKGTVQEEVRQLLCTLTRDNKAATESLCNLLMDRIAPSLYGLQTTDFGSGVRHEIALLAAMVKKDDECWELKLRCMMQLFLTACEDSRNPLVMDSIILPCLKILRGLVKPPPPTSKKHKDKLLSTLSNVKEPSGLSIDVYRWLQCDEIHTYNAWLKRQSIKPEPIAGEKTKSKEELHNLYLTEKYWRKWRNNMFVKGGIDQDKFCLDMDSWLKVVLFNGSSRLARQVACTIVESMCGSFERKRKILLLLTSYLDEVSKAGESSAEFLTMYQSLIEEVPWKQFLALQGVLIKLAKLLTYEIQELHRLEETTLTSDLAQGYALIQLTEILQTFLDNDAIRRQYKGRLVADVLNGYLSLKRLVVQRTRLVDDTQEKLLELLEEMTTGTEEETKAFMAVCIETVDKFSNQDVLTPVFIFERLCSIIYPEENDIGEFFLTLEKDPQQEDFLQGRMLGNPYSSLEAGLGPLMRNVKNKICLDCELVALLEDDNGMELLVNNKIISLDLPVKEVYKKVWLAEGGEGDSMRVVYRMRGLLGDATEEFIETLNAKSQETVNNEEVYKMANVLADCGGLRVMLSRLAAIKNISKAKSLLQVLLKLFRLCVKVKRNREVLTQPELRAIEVFLSVLCVCLESESDSSQAVITEQLLDIMETVLSDATSQALEEFLNFSQTFGGPEFIKSLLTCSTTSNVRNNQSVLVHLTRVLAALVYGNQEKMEILLDYFKPVLSFNKFDFEHTSDDEHKLEMFCILTTGIEKNAIGNTLKDYIISLDIVSEALEYIAMHSPCVKPTLIKTDSDELKEFISKPALKYILRFLTGLAQEHEKTQLAAEDIIPIIHCLEQVSSDEHVGSLAENLLEALKTNETVATNIEQVRAFTRSEKKRLAMAMREKQLGALGMRTNDKGQVTAKSVILQQMEELGDETGLICCICREGYKYQPTKVLGIYTFTKRCIVEEFECKSRKTVGYNTVTHFNVVHVDCHMSAVRLARARDEWESAALQNANTKCNGLLPLWGPQVPESAFASCLARHNTYLQESTGHRDIGHQSTVHDLKLLLLRFAQEKSFHDDTGGGGPQSNLHMIPYLIHMGLYVINTTRSAAKEDKSLSAYLEIQSGEKELESSYEAEGPLYWATMSVLLHSQQRWQTHRLAHLRRLIVLAHTRHCSPVGPVKTLEDREPKDYSVYKPYLIFFGLIDGIYNCFFKNVSGSEEQWPTNLADYIRHNDEAMLKASERLLNIYTEELLPSASFDEFCDVTGLLSVISNPDMCISNVLRSI